MDEYVCVRVHSRPGEVEGAFNKRLIAFWSHFLRTQPVAYSRVYAETTRFEPVQDRLVRQYLVGVDAVPILVSELSTGGLEHEAIDQDELFSKFEAVAPDWFQIPH